MSTPFNTWWESNFAGCPDHQKFVAEDAWNAALQWMDGKPPSPPESQGDVIRRCKSCGHKTVNKTHCYHCGLPLA